MLKSILVPIDGTAPSNAALTLAINICEGVGASIEGLGLVERPMVVTPTAALSGKYVYKEAEHRPELLQKISERSATLLSAAAERCRDEGVGFSEAAAEGPIQELVEIASEANDLTIIGRSTSFNLDADQHTSDIVKDTARAGRRPVIVVPSNLPDREKIIIGYDGSRSASRTIHMLSLLGLAEGMHAEVVSVHSDKKQANKLANRGATLLERHGISPITTAIESGADPADVLLERSESGGMLVIGSFGHRSITDFIFGTCTKAILDACPVPVFLYH